MSTLQLNTYMQFNLYVWTKYGNIFGKSNLNIEADH